MERIRKEKIMICSLKFVYNDNKDVLMTIAADKLEGLFNALNAKQMYFDEGNKMGFWTDVDKLRYVQAMFHPTPGEGDVKQEAPASFADLSKEDASAA